MSIMQSLRGSGVGHRAASKDTEFLNALSQAGGQSIVQNKGAAAVVFAAESVTDTARLSQTEQAATSLQSVLQTALDALNGGAGSALRISSEGVRRCAESIAVGGALSVSAGSEANIPMFTNVQSGVLGNIQAIAVDATGAPGYAFKRDPRIVRAMESFDQREQRQAALYTMAYNYTASIQTEAFETLYPLLNLPANEIGFGIVINRLTVHKGLTHSVTGKMVELEKIDLTRAPVDNSVLSRSKNKVVPIYRDAAADSFSSKVGTFDVDVDGEKRPSRPLKVGVDIDLLGLSQTDAMLTRGATTQTDTLDPAIQLEYVYVDLGNDEIVKIKVLNRDRANFVYNQQGRPEERQLNFRCRYIVLNKDTKTFDDQVIAQLPLAAKNLTVVLDIGLDGEVNTEFGTMNVRGGRIGVVRVYNSAMQPLPATDADYQDIVATIGAASIDSYTPLAWRTNVDLKEKGQFIDRSQIISLYEVPLLSPITCQRPVTSNGEHDGVDYQTLVTTIRFRLMGDGVTAVLDHVDTIRDFVQAPFLNEDAPAGLGAARFHVKPVLLEDKIDVAEVVQALDSKDVAANVTGVLVNKLRDMAFSMYIHSEYESALMATGFVGEVTICVLTDPYIRRYLQLDGEVRLGTEKFKIKIVDTLDKRFRGKMFATFVNMAPERNQAPIITNWGNLIYSPEQVVSTDIQIGDSKVRSTIVQPRYRFVNHLPVALMIEVENISAAFKENYLKVKQL